MPWFKEITGQVKNNVIDIYQSGRLTKLFLGLWASSEPRWKSFSTNGETNFGEPSQEWLHKLPIANPQVIQNVSKEPRTISKELQVSLASVKVSVSDSTIRKRLERDSKNGIHKRDPRQKPLLTKNDTKAHLIFARKHDDPQDFWDLEVMRQKLNFLDGVLAITSVVKLTQLTIRITTVKHGVGRVMVWDCYAAFSTAIWKNNCQFWSLAIMPGLGGNYLVT